MGQYDSETDAALAQLNFEELAKTPGGEFAEIIGDLLSLAGVAGPLAAASGVSNLILKIRRLAGASYTSNLIYSITAVAHALKSLREISEELRKRVDELPKNPQFAEAISALALRAMQTSVKDRLKRLARIVVNGVKENDLEQESLDDMMRAAVELKEADIKFLEKLYMHQVQTLRNRKLDDDERMKEMTKNWPNELTAPTGRERVISGYRMPVARLQAHAFVQFRTPGFDIGGELVFLLEDGAKFFEILRDIAQQ